MVLIPKFNSVIPVTLDINCVILIKWALINIYREIAGSFTSKIRKFSKVSNAWWVQKANHLHNRNA